jgi:hypothetical protein
MVLPKSLALLNEGINTASSMAIMEITTSNSTSVNPFSFILKLHA